MKLQNYIFQEKPTIVRLNLKFSTKPTSGGETNATQDIEFLEWDNDDTFILSFWCLYLCSLDPNLIFFFSDSLFRYSFVTVVYFKKDLSFDDIQKTKSNEKLKKFIDKERFN